MPSSPLLDQRAVLHAYHHLSRQALKAIRYSVPGRHVLRTTMRNSFRSSPIEDFDPTRIANTLLFLERATRTTGLEHKIVKNILFCRYWELPGARRESKVLRSLGLGNSEHSLRKSAYEQLNSTLELLNQSLGTCLR
ncbi:uncharacterized protein PFLUO_LOCUS4240 [Penicillium psychrofluorescens]|uniref:uncharacterized protein n=1 Tax=Penicillium psychrofluorescens TaxID=3158075 RepID=UPI003CCDD2E4